MVDSPHTSHTFVYKTVGDLSIQVDVHVPKTPPTDYGYSVLFHIHGGGWVAGDRALHSLPGFRLLPEATMYEIWDDIADAYHWTRTEAPKLVNTKFNLNKIGILGGSAGGYLACLAGYKLHPRPCLVINFCGLSGVHTARYNTPKQPGDCWYAPLILPEDLVTKETLPKQVATYPVWDSTGNITQRNFLTDYWITKGTVFKTLYGFEYKDNPAKGDDWVIVKNISPDYPPSYFIHCKTDRHVSFDDSAEIVEELKKHAIDHEFVVLPVGDHITPFLPGEPGLAALPTIYSFIEKHLL